MKVLVIGNGGREHSIVLKLSQSPKVKEIYCAPGNGGTDQIAKNLNLQASDFNGLLEFAKKEGINLTIVGPENPLCGGIVDLFERNGLRIFGPTAKAAEIEGSKAYAKDFMEKYNIPTARYIRCETLETAYEALDHFSLPVVIKADGLAAGKGVHIAENKEEAKAAILEMMKNESLGDAGKRIVLEEFLIGEEVSVLAFCDGNTAVPMVSAQDHKAIFDGDKGPNTGGMGTYSPAPIYTKEIHDEVMDKIMIPAVKGLREEGRPFKGVLYGGIILTSQGPKTLEFNARFGDPETQVILPRLKTDLVDIIEASIDGHLKDINIEWDDKYAVCVVLASEGYPGNYKTGFPISIGRDSDDTYYFHAGTRTIDGVTVTSGGRVLGVTAVGDSLKGAIEKAYEGIKEVDFEGMYYRKDIGQKGLKHLE